MSSSIYVFSLVNHSVCMSAFISAFISVQDVHAYKNAYSLSNGVWEVVQVWNFFDRDTLGKQWVRSVDSISANIAEGFGRFFKKEKIQFYRYALGSVSESLDWCRKAEKRKLLPPDRVTSIRDSLQSLPKEIHALIQLTNKNLRY